MPFLRAFLPAFILIAAVPKVESAEPATLPGGVWAIVPPPGFQIITNPIAAFRHPSGAVIVIQDAPKEPISRSEFDRGRAANPGQAAGIRFDQIEEVTVNGRHGLLVVMHIRKKRRTAIVLQLEGEQSNGIIAATLPDGVTTLTVDGLKQALMAAVERPRVMEDRLASLPFVIGDRAELRVVNHVPGAGVLLTEGPSDDPDTTTDQPFASVATLRGGSAADRLNFHSALDGMIDEVRKLYPDAVGFAARVIDERRDQLAEITYQRRIGANAKPVAGIAWFKVSKRRLVFAACQYPLGDRAAQARLRRVFDSITVK